MTPPENGPEIPPAPPIRHEPLTEIIHGVPVADPFRVLEDGADPADPGVGGGPERAHRRGARRRCRPAPGLRDRLRHAAAAPGRRWRARSRGDRVFSLERWGHHDQAVLVVRSAHERRAGPAPSSTRTCQTGDPTAAIDWFHPSPDGRLVAYGVSTGGDERSTPAHRRRRDRRAPPRHASPTPGPARWPGCPTAPASPTPATPSRPTLPPEDQGYWRKVVLAPPRRRLAPRRADLRRPARTRPRGPTSRSPPTVAGSCCTCRSGGAGSTCTSSTARPAPAR